MTKKKEELMKLRKSLAIIYATGLTGFALLGSLGSNGCKDINKAYLYEKDENGNFLNPTLLRYSKQNLLDILEEYEASIEKNEEIIVDNKGNLISVIQPTKVVNITDDLEEVFNYVPSDYSLSHDGNGNPIGIKTVSKK